MHKYPHTYQTFKAFFQDDTAWVKKVSGVPLLKGLSPPTPPPPPKNKTQDVKMGISIYRGGGINLKNIYIKFSLIIGTAKLGIFRCTRASSKCTTNKVQ